jgi:hypothetical protein
MKKISFGLTKYQKTKNTKKTPNFGTECECRCRVKCREKLKHKCRAKI